jgi:hypothetical protein
MNHSKIAAAAVLAGVLLTLSGCVNNDPYVSPFAPAKDPLTKETYPQITADGDLAGWLVYDKPTITHDSGILHVTVPVRTVTTVGEWMKVQYRYIFLDANNVPVKAQPDWQSQTMEPRQQVFLQGNALDTNAVDWRLEIRKQR